MFMTATSCRGLLLSLGWRPAGSADRLAGSADHLHEEEAHHLNEYVDRLKKIKKHTNFDTIS